MADTGTLTLVHCTVTNNRARRNDNPGTPGEGGGLLANGTETITNSIITGNFNGLFTTPVSDDISGTVESASFSLIGDPATSGGITDGANGNIVGADPACEFLSPFLADNGGTTQTHFLVKNSLAIDAGSNLAALDESGTPLTADQRGFVRIADGDRDSTATVDMGTSRPSPAPSLSIPSPTKTTRPASVPEPPCARLSRSPTPSATSPASSSPSPAPSRSSPRSLPSPPP